MRIVLKRTIVGDWDFCTSIKVVFRSSQVNRPFYNCMLSYLAMNASEAGGDLALIQTSLLFPCKYQLVSIRTTSFTQQKQSGLYQNNVTSSLAAIQRPGHQADNCKMVYCVCESMESGPLKLFD